VIAEEDPWPEGRYPYPESKCITCTTPVSNKYKKVSSKRVQTNGVNPFALLVSSPGIRP